VKTQTGSAIAPDGLEPIRKKKVSGYDRPEIYLSAAL
jgi:hypothetical protein